MHLLEICDITYADIYTYHLVCILSRQVVVNCGQGKYVELMHIHKTQ